MLRVTDWCRAGVARNGFLLIARCSRGLRLNFSLIGQYPKFKESSIGEGLWTITSLGVIRMIVSPLGRTRDARVKRDGHASR